MNELTIYWMGFTSGITLMLIVIILVNWRTIKNE